MHCFLPFPLFIMKLQKIKRDFIWYLKSTYWNYFLILISVKKRKIRKTRKMKKYYRGVLLCMCSMKAHVIMLFGLVIDFKEINIYER